MKKFATMVTSVALIGAMVAGGSLAYLSDTDSAVNVMTLGKVDITQHEYQRATNADGTFKTDTIDNKTSYVLEAFEQGKPLLPATEIDANGKPYNFGAGNWDATTVRMSQVGSQGGMQVFESPLAVDKFVTVENTGRSDAYIRTLIAYETGSLDIDQFKNVIGSSLFMIDQGVWNENGIGIVEIEGNNYYAYEYIYKGGAHLGGVHENGILPAGATTYPSLAQVYMKATATNEDCKNIDGNSNGTYDILVLSQAVQADGFADAKTALEAGFGVANVANVQEWFGEINVPSVWTGEEDVTWYDENADEFTIATADEFAGFAALANESGKDFAGKTIKLASDIDLNGIEWAPIADYSQTEEGIAFKGTFDGQGYTIHNLTINRPAGTADSWCVGLFGALEDGVVKNINVENVDIVNNWSYTGAIVGHAASGTISNAHVSGDIKIEDNAYVGGIAGFGKATIENCSVIGNDGSYVRTPAGTGQSFAGGIIGYREMGAYEIVGCTVENIDITANAALGAITGIMGGGNIVTDCVANDVTLNKVRVDGRPSIGLVSGCWYGSGAFEVTDNAFKNITLNGSAIEAVQNDALYGTGYATTDVTFNGTVENNTIVGLKNNITVNN